MWILTPVQSGGETHYLLSSKQYVVGRKNCDIILPSDQSISRAHAHLSATDQTLILKDTSKYGTFVNSQRLTAPATLKSGDEVTFGVFDSKFSVARVKPVVCSSCLDNDGKALLSQDLLALGGKMVNTWTEDCTHLVMPSVKVTIKTISALLCCRPIVKQEFFSELNKAVQQKLPPPKPESFTPEIDEPSLRKEDAKLEVTSARKQLFRGKTFVFLSAKQLKRLSAAVCFGGGSTRQLEEGSLPRDLLESPQSCVIDGTTGSSQSLLSSSAIEWANSVKSIVQRKGLRIITESEIGLAAIYASSDKYCNPSSQIGESESVPKVSTRIPSGSLSQNMAVDETVLPAASQNVTAYAVNTEQYQGTGVPEVSWVGVVGETPEKKQSQNSSQLHWSKLDSQKAKTECVVPDTMNSSLDAAESFHSQRKKPDSKVPGGGTDGRLQPSSQRTNGGSKTFFHKQSPQKVKSSSQSSPQKQSTLTNFFQPVSKKRPLDDELSDVMSESKRPVLNSFVTPRGTNLSTTSKPQSPDNLFGRQSEAVKEDHQSRKRKGIEDEIPMEELESLMSMDMDCFDEPLTSTRVQPACPPEPSSAKQKQDLNTEESSSKRQRLHQEENRLTKPQLRGDSQKEPSHQERYSKQQPVSVKTEPDASTHSTTTRLHTSKAAVKTSASSSKSKDPFEEDEASFIDDLELLKAEDCQPKEEAPTLVKPLQIKKEVQESKIDEDLPKKLVLVQFRSLTVSAPAKTKPKQRRGAENGNAKNFKCFRKSQVAEGFTHIIGGSDLLVHSRGKNSDLDEWLKDAAEDELLKRRDETVGDDLFRYNPTKVTKRR